MDNIGTLQVELKYSEDAIRVIVAAAQFNAEIMKHKDLVLNIPNSVARSLATLQRSIDMFMTPQRVVVASNGD